MFCVHALRSQSFNNLGRFILLLLLLLTLASAYMCLCVFWIVWIMVISLNCKKSGRNRTDPCVFYAQLTKLSIMNCTSKYCSVMWFLTLFLGVCFSFPEWYSVMKLIISVAHTDKSCLVNGREKKHIEFSAALWSLPRMKQCSIDSQSRLQVTATDFLTNFDPLTHNDNISENVISVSLLRWTTSLRLNNQCDVKLLTLYMNYKCFKKLLLSCYGHIFDWYCSANALYIFLSNSPITQLFPLSI